MANEAFNTKGWEDLLGSFRLGTSPTTFFTYLVDNRGGLNSQNILQSITLGAKVLPKDGVNVIFSFFSVSLQLH